MAASARLTTGTIEYLPIRVADALGLIGTLDSKDLRFDLYSADDAETDIVLNMSAANLGLVALPLIDTTLLDEGKYAIFLTFENTPEIPRLGPFFFVLAD